MCFTQIIEIVAASPSDLLFTKPLSCAVSANHVQDRAATSHVQGKCFSGYQQAFLLNLSVGLYVWEDDTAISEQ